ncbi:MAG: hypothetical protein WDW36_010230 [Sanguina aurantia]
MSGCAGGPAVDRRCELGIASQLACLPREQPPNSSHPTRATPRALPTPQPPLAAAPATGPVHPTPDPPSTLQPVAEPQPTHAQQRAGVMSPAQGPRPGGASGSPSPPAGATRAPVSVSSEVQEARAGRGAAGGAGVSAALQPPTVADGILQTAGAPGLCGQGAARLRYTSAALRSLGERSRGMGAASAGMRDLICAAGVEMTQ